ncbi:MAG: hypothetical protein HQ521_02195, partial [Bacteroidetes bacterium]|nr:hypothetical protein [Bacteroidota bacterium]
AHPILSREYNLYTPNKETTRAHIRNALEGILTKPPILSKDIVSDFLENLSRIKDIIITDEDLKRHINSRYLSKINLTVENQLFRSLWKLTFRSDDVKCTENRIYNLKVLNIIVDNNYREYQKVISNESDYYSDINTKYLRELFSLFNQFPKLYEFLNDSAKVLIENFIKKDSDFEALAWFITGDIGTHMEMILEHRKEPLETYTNYRICAKSILQINNDSIASVQKEERHRFIIKMFGYSYDFDNADELYDMVINPYLKDFSKKSLKLLVSKANGNSQIYGRKAAPRTLNEIRMEVDKRYNSGFNYEPYTNFWRAMEY